MMSLKGSIAAGFACALLFLLVADGPDFIRTTPALPHLRRLDANTLQLKKIPQDLLRRAAQLVEDAKDSGAAPTWEDETVDFVDDVRALKRPDVEEEAYYELRLENGNGDPVGFIVLATGGHDHPISHWSSEGPSPTMRLDQQVSGNNDKIKTYYKIDALSYAGENASGELVAELGGLPNEIKGLSLDDVGSEDPESFVDVSHTESLPGGDDEDSGRRMLAQNEKKQGTNNGNPNKWEFVEGGKDQKQRWRNLKSNFQTSYEVLLDSLKKSAMEGWETEKAASEYGHALVVGEPFRMALLHRLDTFALSKEGAENLTVERKGEGRGRQKLIVEAHSADPTEPLEVALELSYNNGEIETIMFVIIPDNAVVQEQDDGGQHRRMTSFSLAQDVQKEPKQQRSRKLWSSWSYWWAGSKTDQRYYYQFTTGGCKSGCGATAWAMLFGWGDYRASFDPKWSGRFGLYRANGGYGTNVVAPKHMDEGIKNIVREIRSDIGTWCVPFSSAAATNPWDMQDAKQYLVGRSGTGMKTSWNSLGISTKGLMQDAREAIKFQQTPAIIGTGWLSHYPLAYGFASRYQTVRTCVPFYCWTNKEYQRWFYVNNGWGGYCTDCFEWVPADTWFSGTIIP